MNKPKFSLAPLAGIDNASGRDDALVTQGDARRVFLRDAVNVTIDEGRASMRPGLRPVSSAALRSLWQSPLHGDVFAASGEQWVKVDTSDWSATVLADIGLGDVAHMVLNGQVVAVGSAGIWRYNGQDAQRLTLERPPQPMVSAGAGSLAEGAYGVAVAWLRGALESPMSAMATCTVPADGALEVTLPLCMDDSVTGARLYLTRANGGELLRAEEFPIGTVTAHIALLPALGAASPFQHTIPMPGGTHAALWRGRIVTATAGVLRFSEAMAYHVHDPRHGFVQMPQRITFLAPVDGGIFVGQVDHVVFLRGTSPQDLVLDARTGAAPVPGSAVALPAQAAGEASGGGQAAVAWLAGNGYVLGTPDGAIIETRARRLKGITGARGPSVVLDGRLLTAVS